MKIRLVILIIFCMALAGCDTNRPAPMPFTGGSVWPLVVLAVFFVVAVGCMAKAGPARALQVEVVTPKEPVRELWITVAGVGRNSDLAWRWQEHLERTVNAVVSWWNNRRKRYTQRRGYVYNERALRDYFAGGTPVLGWLEFTVRDADDFDKLYTSLAKAAPALTRWKFKKISVSKVGNRVRVEASWPDDLRPKTVKPVSGRTPTLDNIAVGLGADGAEVSISLELNALIAGTTGAGKSVLLQRMVIQAAQAGAKLILLDGKVGEGLEDVAEGPGMIFPLQTETEEIAKALAWARKCMEDRYKLSKSQLKREPWIVVVLDEYEDVLNLKTGGSKLAVDAVDKLSRQCRAARMTLILATQHPKESGTFSKTNLPTRVGLRVNAAFQGNMIMGTKDYPLHRLERFEAYVDPPGERVSLYEPLANMPEGFRAEAQTVPTDWLVADQDRAYIARHLQRRERDDGTLCAKVKIGHSNDPSVRVGGFVEDGWEILLMEPGGEDRERALHRMFDAHRCSPDKETFWLEGLIDTYLRKSVLDFQTSSGVSRRKAHGNAREPTPSEVVRYRELVSAGASKSALKRAFALPGRKQAGQGFLTTLAEA